MGYDIFIGEVQYDGDGYGEGFGEPSPKKFQLPEAPSLAIQSDLTRRTNWAYPSHGWDFLAEAGLDKWIGKWLDLKTNVYPLTEQDYTTVHQALENWVVTHPQAVTNELLELDDTLQRLIWFDWWVRWALDNCTEPVIYSCG